MKHWIKEELNYLSENWGTVSIPRIARRLGRSVNAVKIKAIRIGLKRHIHSGVYITVNQLAKAINHDYKTVRNWEKYGLKMKRKKSIKTAYKIIEVEDFWEWAKCHKPLVHFDRIEPLILGMEPKWVAYARRADIEGKKRRTKWTRSDDEKLIHLLDQYKFSVGEIAAELGRTEGAIKRRVLDLGIKQRPVKQTNRKWTEKQIATMLDMLDRGYGFEQIGKQLGRTGSAVRGKLEQLNNPEYKSGCSRGEQPRVYNGVEWRKTDD